MPIPASICHALAGCIALALFVSCGGGEACLACGEPMPQGALANPELAEVSGVAASSRLTGVLYAHNDSGDSSRFFAVSSAGAQLGVFKVTDAQNVDWEDMDRGPCPAGSCLYIADIGDNAGTRAAYSIYRVVEPAEIVAGVQSIAAERFVFTYPDGAHDAEVLLVHPVTGEVTIVTKVEEGPAQVFALPRDLKVGTGLTAAEVGAVAPPNGDNRFTGGSIHPDGTAILMRSRSSLFYYPMQPEQSAAEALSGAPCELPVADELLGEAVAWLPGGAEFVTLGEGVGAVINLSSCARD